MHRNPHAFVKFLRQRRHWQTNTTLCATDQSQLLHRPLHRDRVGFDKQILVQPEQFRVEVTRGLRISGKRCCAHLMHQFWCHVGSHRNGSLSAKQYERQRRRIITTIDGEAFWCAQDQIGSALDVSGRILDADDAWKICQTQCRVVRQISDGTARHVVQNQRQIDCFRNRFEVLVEPFLRRLVVVGHDGEMRIRAGLAGKFAEFNRFAC